MLPEESNKLKRYFKKRFNANYEELSKNDFALHKQLVKEGHNPNEIAKIIRNEDLEKLQELSSQTNFDFNQTIPKSLYERCSFINKENVTLIDYAAFFSSVKCFKYLLMNGAKVYYTYEYAIAGGNLEIIHLCAQNKAAFKNLYKTSIEFHRNDIFKYLYENKIYINLKKIGKKCLLYHNYEILSFLLENRMKINNFIMNETARAGNIFLLKHFHKFKQLPKNIFVFASESGNIEIVKYVLGQKEIDIHLKNIHLLYLIITSIF